MNAGSIALGLSAIALGVAVFALTDDEPESRTRVTRSGTDGRVAALEAQVAHLAREVESLRADKPELVIEEFRSEDGGRVAIPVAVGGENDPALAKIVDAAVDKKAKQVMDEMRVKADKKPVIDVFAQLLDLTPEQRAATERVIVEGQRQVHEILNTPTENGSILLDDLLVLVAKGIAQPGKDHGWGGWVGRVLAEKIPGTDVTYGARIETVKNEMRESFKRDWTKEQYQEFQQWGVDPTEIKDVPDSPNEGLEARIIELARRFGADIPEQAEK